MSFVCETCGKEHSELPLDIAFDKPAHYYAVPKAERESRCVLTANHCIIDSTKFFLRGVILIPIIGTDTQFGWGVWAAVSDDVFHRYMELNEPPGLDGSGDKPYPAILSGEHKGYEGLHGHPVLLQFGMPDERPRFILRRSDHLMYREQQSGITQGRVHEILDNMFPDGF